MAEAEAGAEAALEEVDSLRVEDIGEAIEVVGGDIVHIKSGLGVGHWREDWKMLRSRYLL